MTDQTRPMDAERLEEIRQRAEAATSEPWSGAAIRFIGLARADVRYLLDLVASLTAERDMAIKSVPIPLGRDELGRELRESDYLRDQLADMTRERDEWKAGMRADFDLRSKALATVDELSADLALLRAVIEEARAKAESARRHLDVDSRRVADRILKDAIAILERVKGEGE